MDDYYERVQRQRPPRHLPDRRGGHRRPRERPAPRSPASSTRPARSEVVFTKNATEALNLVAKAWGRAHLRAGDAVVLTELEHHANIVPWHQLAAELGIELRWIPVQADGHLDLTDLDRLVDGAKVVSFAAMSNVLGTMLPVERLVDGRPRRRRPRRGRRLPARPPPRHRRAGLGRRLRRLHRPQDVRPHRHRRALGSRGGPRRHAPVPRRRRDDPQRHQGGLHAQRAAVEVRGRHAADRRGGRPRRGRRLPQRPRHGRRARARGGAHRPTPCAPSTSASATTSRSTARRAGRPRRRAVVHASATSTPTTSPRCSTSTACACGPATTAPSR